MSDLSVSVVIPAYRAARTIRRAVDSVLAQSQPADEIIIVDDGSPDDIAAAVRPYGDQLKYLQKSNGGAGSARNAGIDVATGGLVAFLDADDYWEPDKLRRQLAVFRTHPQVELVAGGAPRLVEGPVAVEPMGPNRMVTRSAIGSMTFNEQDGAGTYPMGEDSELMMRLHSAGHRFTYLPNAGIEDVIEPHALRLRWLLNRAYRSGRGDARLGKNFVGPQLISVPRYIWRRLLTAVVMAGSECVRGKKRRWEACMGLWHVVGMIREFRAMAGEFRQDRQESVVLSVDPKVTSS